MFGIVEPLLNMSGLLTVNLAEEENLSWPLAVVCVDAQSAVNLLNDWMILRHGWMDSWLKKKLCETTSHCWVGYEFFFERPRKDCEIIFD